LRAVSALPRLEEALKNLPKDEEQQDFYKAALRRAIAELKRARDKGKK
jgi:hypothetical protein